MKSSLPSPETNRPDASDTVAVTLTSSMPLLKRKPSRSGADWPGGWLGDSAGCWPWSAAAHTAAAATTTKSRRRLPNPACMGATPAEAKRLPTTSRILTPESTIPQVRSSDLVLFSPRSRLDGFGEREPLAAAEQAGASKASVFECAVGLAAVDNGGGLGTPQPPRQPDGRAPSQQDDPSARPKDAPQLADELRETIGIHRRQQSVRIVDDCDIEGPGLEGEGTGSGHADVDERPRPFGCPQRPFSLGFVANKSDSASRQPHLRQHGRQASGIRAADLHDAVAHLDACHADDERVR